MLDAPEFETFGALLRQHRIAAGLTQQELADRAGVSLRAVQTLERGPTRPHADTFERLARALALKGEQLARLQAVRRRSLPSATPSSRAPAPPVTFPGRGDHDLHSTAQPFALTPRLRDVSARFEPMGADSPDSGVRKVVPNNLLSPVTNLIGRDHELANLRQTLGLARLLTLTGPGGCGKTQLGLAVAEQVLDLFTDGVFVVELAPLNDVKQVIPAIVQTLDIPESPGQSPSPLLHSYLRDRQVLLVLDNFEHLLAGARLVADLLATCRRLKILITSRERLHLSGEHEFPVLPFALPDQAVPLADLARNPAVSLFCGRARAVDPSFELNAENALAVAEICIRLDGLPLAIELAAARVKYLSLATLLARLNQRLAQLVDGPRDALTRHQTMRAAIAWSDALLDSEERALFRSLSVFVGGCTIPAAAEVAGATGGELEDTARGLESLVNRSLLAIGAGPDGEPRFTMLEVVREYAAECLRANGTLEEARRRHAGYFVSLAEAVSPTLNATEQALAFSRLALEQGNLRAVLAWAVDRQDTLTGVRLAAALSRFWEERGYVAEERRRVDELLAEDEKGRSSIPAGILARALLTSGALAAAQGAIAMAQKRLEDALVLFRRVSDEQGTASALSKLGILAYERGKFSLAERLHVEALAIQRQNGDLMGQATSLSHLGIVAANQAELTQASASYEESLAIQRQLGNVKGIARALSGLGLVARIIGDLTRAEQLHEESLTLRRSLGSPRDIAHSVGDLAKIASDRADDRRATELFQEVLAVFQALGDKRGAAWVLAELGALAGRSGDLAKADGLLAESVSLHREIQNVIGEAYALVIAGIVATRSGQHALALTRFKQSGALLSHAKRASDPIYCLEGLAELALARNKVELAARWYAAAAATRARLRVSRTPVEQEALDDAIGRIKGSLGQGVFEQEWETGFVLSLNDALTEALSLLSDS